MASHPTCTSIYNLPEEILSSIVSLLDIDPPSIVHASEVPSAALWQTLERPDLKNLSLVCQDWRRIAFPILFKYVKLDLSDQGLVDGSSLSNIAWPSEPSEFITALSKVTISVLIYTSSSRVVPPKFLRRLYSLLSPSRLLLVVEPTLWWFLLSVKVKAQDAWAFEIPYQSVECRQHRRRSLCGTTRMQHPSTATAPWNLLEFQTWDEIRLHGGNCLTNFGTCMCMFHLQVMLTFSCAGRPWIWQVLSAYTKPMTLQKFQARSIDNRDILLLTYLHGTLQITTSRKNLLACCLQRHRSSQRLLPHN